MFAWWRALTKQVFFFSSEQFEGIEVEDVLDRLTSPLLNFSLFAQIGTNKDTIYQNVDTDTPLIYCWQSELQAREKCGSFLITWACPLPLGRGSNKASTFWNRMQIIFFCLFNSSIDVLVCLLSITWNLLIKRLSTWWPTPLVATMSHLLISAWEEMVGYIND